jgi:5'-nucleotidase (lipoprotein e(P4) family)
MIIKRFSKLALLFSLIFIIISCSNQEKNSLFTSGSSDHLLNATLWYQKSGEMRANYYQAFNLAKLSLEKNLQNYTGDKKPAIVFDIDETLLNNSYFEADLIIAKNSYTPENWKEWSDKQCATDLPGAIDFVNFAINTEVEIFYVSNRTVKEVNSTYNNMQELGFPEIPIENFIFKETTSSKIDRRNSISENFEIILLLGDNLNDFNGIFEARNVNSGFEAVDNNKDLFGDKYIIFPNPMYGNWEKPLIKDESLSKYEHRIKALISSYNICKDLKK